MIFWESTAQGGESANGQSRNPCREARRFTAIIITHSLAKHSIPTTGLLFFHVRKLHKTARSGWDVLRWTINKVRWKHSLPTHKYKALHVKLKILWSATPTPSFCRPKQNECGLTIQSSLGWVAVWQGAGIIRPRSDELLRNNHIERTKLRFNYISTVEMHN